MADIPGDTGEGLDIRRLISGADIVGVYPSGTFNVVAGSKSWIMDTTPIAADRNNERWKFVYSGNVIGSMYNYIGTGSFLQVWAYSGNRVTDIGSWGAV